MQSRGLEFLYPIWKLITHRDYLNLSFNDVKVYYTKCHNDYKKSLGPNEVSITEAVQAGLTPGNCFKLLYSLSIYLVANLVDGPFNSHAVILDTIKDNQLIFKNTDSDNKQIRMKVDAENSPDEFYFIHIELYKNGQVSSEFKQPHVSDEIVEHFYLDFDDDSSTGTLSTMNRSVDSDFAVVFDLEDDLMEEDSYFSDASDHKSGSGIGYKRTNSTIFEYSPISNKISKIVGYRYKLSDLYQPSFTTVYVSLYWYCTNNTLSRPASYVLFAISK